MTTGSSQEKPSHRPDPAPEVHRVPKKPEIPMIPDVDDFLDQQEQRDKSRRDIPSKYIH